MKLPFLDTWTLCNRSGQENEIRHNFLRDYTIADIHIYIYICHICIFILIPHEGNFVDAPQHSVDPEALGSLHSP